MKHYFITILSYLFFESVFAETITLNWYVDGNDFVQTTCNTGEDITIPITGEKQGYTFHGWRSLPYIPLEYIQSSGEQEISSGIPASKRLSVDIVYEDIGNTNENFVFGGVSTGGGGVYQIGKSIYCLPSANYNTGTHFCYGFSTCYSNTAACTEISKAAITNKKCHLYINPQTRTIIFNNNQITMSVNKELTQYYPMFGIIQKGAKIKLYSLKLFVDDEKVRDFIPARDLNGVVCLFDNVSKTFFYNTGTGNFIAGPVKTYIDEE